MKTSANNSFLNLIDWENQKLQRSLMINDLQYYFKNDDTPINLRNKIEKIRLRLLRDLIWIHNFIGIPCEINPYEKYLIKTDEYNLELKLQIKKTLGGLENISSINRLTFNKQKATEEYRKVYSRLETIRANMQLMKNLYLNDETYLFPEMEPIRELTHDIVEEHSEFIKIHSKLFKENFQKLIKSKKFTSNFMMLLTSILSFTSEVDQNLFVLKSLSPDKQKNFERSVDNTSKDAFMSEIKNIKKTLDNLKRVDSYLSRV